MEKNGLRGIAKNGIKISFVSKHFCQGLYYYVSLSQVKLKLFPPLTRCVRFLASYEGHIPFALSPGWGICTPFPHSGVFVWIRWPQCWTIAAFLRKTDKCSGGIWIDWAIIALVLRYESPWPCGSQSWDPRINWSNSSGRLASPSLTHLKSILKIWTLSWPSGCLLIKFKRGPWF